MAPPRSRRGTKGAVTATSTRSSDAADAATPLSQSATERARFGEALLQWYAANARLLPWRVPPTPLTATAAVTREAVKREEVEAVPPSTSCAGDGNGHEVQEAKQRRAYRVRVSENMCQQTQVSRVQAYFTRWVERWPTVKQLASASIEEVNEAWAGLGYYRRARALLNGAKYIVDECDGQMPDTIEGLRAIPGVGTRDLLPFDNLTKY